MPKVTDSQYRIIVALVGVGLVAGLTTWRFCGDVQIAAKPPAPILRGKTAGELFTASTQTKSVWAGYLESDAHTAGIAVPAESDVAKVLRWQEGQTTTDLAIDSAAIDLAGLSVKFKRDTATDNAVVVLSNAADHPMAYHLLATTSASSYVCNNVKHSPHNTMVVAAHGSEVISVCQFRDGITASIKLQSIELTPLAAYYVQQVPPTLVGVDDKLAKVHRNDRATPSPCDPKPSSGVKGGLGSGKIRWRDLIDFYARHRCETYRFPLTYRSFTVDNERPLPAVSPD
ncbi:MAG: hypothetical protein KBG15_09990 [Kofleriaceae bacterium]|nr:hypothetical protein [Kofleriaceae bacterium]